MLIWTIYTQQVNIGLIMRISIWLLVTDMKIIVIMYADLVDAFSEFFVKCKIFNLE